jgi:aminopeptidase-like protein
MTSLEELCTHLPKQIGADMMALVEELYPICRSITGEGLRATLQIVRRTIPLVIHEVPSGTAVFDWTVPKEWNIRDAYVANSRGEKVVDFRRSNLHVVNYSVPVRARMTLAELRPHLHTLPDRPDWIPYRTTYYDQSWGFCLRHRDFLALKDDQYEVVIDSSLEDGHLTYGELHLPGQQEDEILLTTHVCHPSMCNDNLSGIAVLTSLANALLGAQRRYSYRILFIPGTIGSITWLARNRQGASRIRHGLVLAGVGDRGAISYKRSRRGDAEIDRAVMQVLRDSGAQHRILDFSPYGYDERQFCSPGFDLPVGRFSRSEYGTYPEYHSSADDLEFVAAASLEDSYANLMRVLFVLESNETFTNQNPWCEPQLGKRGLYDNPQQRADWGQIRLALLWVLNLSDGKHSLLDIAARSQAGFGAILGAARALEAAGLLRRQL